MSAFHMRRQSNGRQHQRVVRAGDRRARWVVGLCLCWLLLSLPSRSASTTLDLDRGIVGLLQALERLPVVASVLYTTAHPDDEDSSLLTFLSRGAHTRTVLLTATRGEGGQNLIGPEKDEAMGLLRTGELLAADAYTGVEQRFTRAYEFGYSKTAEETLAKWGEEEILADFVRVIRQERPDIIISRFYGTPRDRHGHHQAAGILTRRAYRAAADPHRFPEQLAAGLRPWQAKKLYQDNFRFFGRSTEPWNVMIDVGRLDPILGRSYHEIGMAGHRQHRSQGLGAILPRKGSVKATLSIVDHVIPVSARESSLFDGIDTSLTGMAARAGEEAVRWPPLRAALAEIQHDVEAALVAFDPHHPEAVAPSILAGLDRLRQLIHSVKVSPLSDDARYELLFLLRHKERDFLDAAQKALNVELDVRAEDETVIPGQTFDVTVGVYNRGSVAVDLEDIHLVVPPHWTVNRSSGTVSRLKGGDHRVMHFSVRVADDAPFTQPYWFRRSRRENRYELRSEAYHTLPFAPPEVVARAICRAFGVDFEITEPARAVHRDRLRGAEFRDVQVVPALSVKLEPRIAIAPLSPARQVHEFRVTILSNVPGPVEGTVELDVPTSWRVTPSVASFHCARKSEIATLAFRVTIPGGLKSQQQRVRAVARLDGREYTSWYQVISYPGIWTRHLYHPAESRVEVFDVKVAPHLNVGYILGTQDEIPEALKQLGVHVELLDEDDLAFGDLSRFDCIIAGVRAYVFRDDLKTHNQRLLEYVKNGGVFIVQYNTARSWNPADYAPYPASMKGNERITVEESPVEILIPDHPVFNRPNKITAADFQGWVQERGLYFWSEWDPHYRPLLSGHDPGEAPQLGGWLEAEYGKGLYVYTAYAWFRQLPAGVPGAYRLFANLISLPVTRNKP